MAQGITPREIEQEVTMEDTVKVKQAAVSKEKAEEIMTPANAEALLRELERSERQNNLSRLWGDSTPQEMAPRRQRGH